MAVNYDTFARDVNRVRNMRAYGQEPGDIHQALVDGGLSPDRAHLVMRAVDVLDGPASEPEGAQSLRSGLMSAPSSE